VTPSQRPPGVCFRLLNGIKVYAVLIFSDRNQGRKSDLQQARHLPKTGFLRSFHTPFASNQDIFAISMQRNDRWLDDPVGTYRASESFDLFSFLGFAAMGGFNLVWIEVDYSIALVIHPTFCPFFRSPRSPLVQVKLFYVTQMHKLEKSFHHHSRIKKWGDLIFLMTDTFSTYYIGNRGVWRWCNGELGRCGIPLKRWPSDLINEFLPQCIAEKSNARQIDRRPKFTDQMCW